MANTITQVTVGAIPDSKIPEKLWDTDSWTTRLKSEVLEVLFKTNLKSISSRIYSISGHRDKVVYSVAVFSTSEMSAEKRASQITEQMVANAIEEQCLKELDWSINYDSQFVLDYVILDPEWIGKLQ